MTIKYNFTLIFFYLLATLSSGRTWFENEWLDGCIYLFAFFPLYSLQYSEAPIAPPGGSTEGHSPRFENHFFLINIIFLHFALFPWYNYANFTIVGLIKSILFYSILFFVLA